MNKEAPFVVIVFAAFVTTKSVTIFSLQKQSATALGSLKKAGHRESVCDNSFF